MTLRVSTAKIVSVGMRKLAEGPLVKRALDTLKGRRASSARCGHAGRRNTKPRSIPATLSPSPRWCATCIRSETQPEQSYSERQLYEAALDRLSREIAAVQRITETEAIKEIEGALAKGPRRGPKPADEADVEPATEEEAA